MNEKYDIQAIIEKMIKEHGQDYGIKLVRVEEDYPTIEISHKGVISTLEII